MAGNIPYHPAPGSIGELLPGFYNVPQNPIVMARQGVTRRPGIAEIIDGYYVVPQNPIVQQVSGNVKPLGTSGCGCSGGSGRPCGCAGKLNGRSIGVGDWPAIQADISAGNYGQIMNEQLLGFPVTTVLLAGVAVYLLLFMGGKESHVSRARRAVRAY